MTNEISNIEDLPENVWKELKSNSEIAIRNAKIAFYQYTTLLALADRKLTEFKTSDAKIEATAIKEALKEALA